MMTASNLDDWLNACLIPKNPVRCVVLVGGGAVADCVRALDAHRHLDPGVAHDQAIAAMRLNAEVLVNGVDSEAMLTNSVAVAKTSERSLMWSPPSYFRPDGLPLSWSVSSDSIALWLADQIYAHGLVLVKHLNPNLPESITVDAASNAGVVDEYFPQMARSVTVPVALCAQEDPKLFSLAREAGRLPGSRLWI